MLSCLTSFPHAQSSLFLLFHKPHNIFIITILTCIEIMLCTFQSSVRVEFHLISFMKLPLNYGPLQQKAGYYYYYYWGSEFESGDAVRIMRVVLVFCPFSQFIFMKFLNLSEKLYLFSSIEKGYLLLDYHYFQTKQKIILNDFKTILQSRLPFHVISFLFHYFIDLQISSRLGKISYFRG